RHPPGRSPSESRMYGPPKAHHAGGGGGKECAARHERSNDWPQGGARGARSAPPNPETSAYPTFRGAPDPYDGRPNMPSVPSKELVTIANPHPDREYEVECVCPEFTCICPMTSQPDFATFTITYVPGPKILELKSLKLYLW